MEQIVNFILAGVPVSLRLHHASSAAYLRRFPQSDVQSDNVIELTAQELRDAAALYPSDLSEARIEFSELPYRVSDVLIPHDRCIFHGVAFSWRGKAYLFTAPSGTGKSTQYVLWKTLLGPKMHVLNGDKPVLSWAKSSEIWVNPSPWSGKEGMTCMDSAPLGGIILLQQSTENSIIRLSPREAVLPIFTQFMFSGATEDLVHSVCKMEEKLLNSVPIWLMKNRGDLDSARMGIDAVTQYEERVYE